MWIVEKGANIGNQGLTFAVSYSVSLNAFVGVCLVFLNFSLGFY